MITCFPPIIDKDTTRIVVGTMPSVDSLRFGEYYGNSRNQFWKILFAVFEGGRVPADYEDKVATAHRHAAPLYFHTPTMLAGLVTAVPLTLLTASLTLELFRISPNDCALIEPENNSMERAKVIHVN